MVEIIMVDIGISHIQPYSAHGVQQKTTLIQSFVYVYMNLRIGFESAVLKST